MNRLRPYRSDDAPWLVERHQTLYAESEGFDDSFGRLVAEILDEFNARHDAGSERGWIAEDTEGNRLGSIFCVRADDATAKLRLFLLVPEARGTGLGPHMLETCMDFARISGYRAMTLWTHESHRAACALYARAGWSLTASKPVTSFGQHLVEQRWDITL